MRTFLRTIFFLAFLTIVFCGCQEKLQPHPAGNALYYWKTTFALGDEEKEFLDQHQVNKLYVRLFDVALERDPKTHKNEIVPIATTKFKSGIPDSVEIVPVVYVTYEALMEMYNDTEHYATLIVERALAMCAHNQCGTIKELQIDCDWTSYSKDRYVSLCQKALEQLHKRDVELSITVRLHQLGEEMPPADKGVLMLYNTGSFKSIETKNSILDIEDVKPYLKDATCQLPLSYAYPVFGWGLLFEGDRFSGIVPEGHEPALPNEQVRNERPTADQILEVKEAVEAQLGKPQAGNILYHLDFSQLKHYTPYEVDQILAY